MPLQCNRHYLLIPGWIELFPEQGGNGREVQIPLVRPSLQFILHNGELLTMTMIIVDQSFCDRCGICSTVCPIAIIEPADEGSLPRIPKEKEGACIACGHCEVSCPSGALSLDLLPDEEEGGSMAAGEIPPGALATFLKARRSVRHFKPDPVDKETIRRLLDITRYAASGGNRHPVQWLVMYDRKEVHHIAGLTIDWLQELAKSNHPMGLYAGRLIEDWKKGHDRICWNAPHLLFAHVPGDAPIGATDATIALTCFDVAAPAFGVGTCWAGFVSNAAMNHEPLVKFLALPPGRKVAYGMMFGYPRYRTYKIPRRKPAEITWR